MISLATWLLSVILRSASVMGWNGMDESRLGGSKQRTDTDTVFGDEFRDGGAVSAHLFHILVQARYRYVLQSPIAEARTLHPKFRIYS